MKRRSVLTVGLIIVVFMFGSRAMADAVIAYESGGNTYLRLVDGETTALGG